MHIFSLVLLKNINILAIKKAFTHA